MYVGERTYYPKLKWDVLLFILTLCEASHLPWWLGFEGLLPELCKNKPTSLTVLGLKPSSSFKANMVSVCVDKNWAVPGRFFQSLPVPCGDKEGRGGAGQGGQGSRCGGRARCHFY